MLEPPQRLRPMRIIFRKFFAGVWMAILLLLISGYWMLLRTFGGFSGAGLYIHLTQLIDWLMGHDRRQLLEAVKVKRLFKATLHFL